MLGRAPAPRPARAGAPAAVDGARRFRQHLHVLAERELDELEHRGLAGARAAGEHDLMPRVDLAARAGIHRARAEPRGAPSDPRPICVLR